MKATTTADPRQKKILFEKTGEPDPPYYYGSHTTIFHTHLQLRFYASIQNLFHKRYDNVSRTRLHPQSPKVKWEPFTMHSGENMVPSQSRSTLGVFRLKHGNFSLVLLVSSRSVPRGPWRDCAGGSPHGRVPTVSPWVVWGARIGPSLDLLFITDVGVSECKSQRWGDFGQEEKRETINLRGHLGGHGVVQSPDHAWVCAVCLFCFSDLFVWYTHMVLSRYTPSKDLL